MSEQEMFFIVIPIDESLLSRTWNLRLRALLEHPAEFGQPWAEAASLTPRQAGELYHSFWTAGDNQVFVAIDANNTIGGMIGAARAREGRAKTRHRMDIWGVYVAPEYRGRGIGAELLNAAIAHCRSIPGVIQVHLQVVSTNLAAIRAYEKAGFRRWGRMPRAGIIDGAALDNDFMLLMLDDGADCPPRQPEGTIL